MGFVQIRQRAADAAFSRLGEPATWRAAGMGAHLAVTVRRRSPDAEEHFGDSRAIVSTVLIKVRKAEVLAPDKGDVVQIGSELFMVGGTPTLDAHGLVWTCQASAATP